ncbi:hypothetical protein [Nocardia sp. NPDC051750]|uniref:hypothetical protein n=1 Tax=Nocardia sp. NPDC051750 TaxID=3364325 RepID=UPI0037B62876
MFYHFLFEIEDRGGEAHHGGDDPAHLLGEGDGLGPLGGLGRAQTAEMRACFVELGQGPARGEELDGDVEDLGRPARMVRARRGSA